MKSFSIYIKSNVGRSFGTLGIDVDVNIYGLSTAKNLLDFIKQGF